MPETTDPELGVGSLGRALNRWQSLQVPDADVRLCPAWLAPRQADALLADLTRSIPWEQHRLRLFGRQIDAPRLSCWIGDPGAAYAYSGVQLQPQPWPAALLPLRRELEQACGAGFNSVLANLYRNGNDSMGWHSDDESTLGAHPVIASVSLGAQRRFRLRRKRPRGETRRPEDTHTVMLEHGSLLLMAAQTQLHYRHDLPKARALAAPRINLTFRWVEPRRR